LLYIGALLERHGMEVGVIDGVGEELKHEDLEDRIVGFDPDVVGIACMMAETYSDSAETARIARRAAPKAKIILGGHNASFVADKIIHNLPESDYVVVGEGEHTFLELVRSIDNKSNIRRVKGVMYRNNGRATFTGVREPIQNLDELPSPAKHLIPQNAHYGHFWYRGYRVALKNLSGMITSRGCPFGCTFCSCTAFSGRKIRARSPENVVEEMEYLVNERGVEQIFIVDDNFTWLPKRVMKICQLIKKRGLEFNWFCEGRVDTASEEMYKSMADAGCWLIFLGLESGSQRILDYYKKKTTVEKGWHAVALAQKAGIDVVGSFIVGSPIETEEDYQRTLDFITRADMDLISMSSLKVLPGTELWQKFEARGLISPEDWNKYFEISDLYDGHPKERVRQWMRAAERKFYFRPNYLIKEIGRMFRRRRHLISYLVRNL
ncbi:MAG: hypothetical protein AVW06_01640, partial [Hadesarchaea archaeon DG-33-1]